MLTFFWDCIIWIFQECPGPDIPFGPFRTFCSFWWLVQLWYPLDLFPVGVALLSLFRQISSFCAAALPRMLTPPRAKSTCLTSRSLICQRTHCKEHILWGAGETTGIIKNVLVEELSCWEFISKYNLCKFYIKFMFAGKLTIRSDNLRIYVRLDSCWSRAATYETFILKGVTECIFFWLCAIAQLCNCVVQINKICLERFPD